MPNYNKVLKSMPHNAVGKKRIQTVASGSSISSVTYVPGSYHYVLTQAGGATVTGSSQNLFGNQIKLSGSSAGGVQLYEASSNGSNYLQFNAPSAITTNFSLTLPDGPPDTSGYALVSTDAGVLSWSAFSGGNTYITGLAYAPSTQKITATLSDSSTVVQSPSLEEFGDSISIKGTNEGHVNLYEKAVNGSAYVSLRGPVDMGTNPSYIISLPVADGTTGQVMARGSGGQLTWVNNDDANYYVTGGTYDAGNDEIDFSGTTGFPAFSVDTSAFAKGSIAGANTYVPYFTAASALTGTNTFKWDNANGFLTLTNATASTSTHTGHPLLILENTNADSYPAGIKLYKNSASSTANDLIGLIRFYANDASGADSEKEYARIEGEVETSTASSEVGKLSFYTVNNGTISRRLWMSGATTTINSNTEITGTVGVTSLITASGGITLPATTDDFTMGGHAVSDILIGADSYPGSNQDDYLVTAKYVNAVSGAIGTISSSSQHYNAFYDAAQGIVGSAYLQTDGSNNIILSGASNIAKTAADFQSTLGVSGNLTVSGAASFKSTLGVGTNATISGTSDLEGATTMRSTLSMYGAEAWPSFKVTPTNDVATVEFKASGANTSTPQFYPVLSLNNIAQDVDPGGGGAIVYADMPTIHFQKLGPRNAVNSANTTAGFRFLASGLSTAGASTTQKQFLVYTYQPDESSGSPSEIAKLDSTGIFTATTFAGELSGTIDSTTTATTQSASNNSTKVATTAYVDAAVSAGGGGGTIGGSITDNQVAIGASTANSIEGADTFKWDASTLTMTNASDTAITLLGDSNRTNADAHVAALRGKWNGTAIGTFMVMSGPDTTNKDDGQLTFQTASAGTLAERMRIDETGNVGIGTTSPQTKLHVMKASAGSPGYSSFANIILESDDHNYLQFSGPTNKNQGVLFGDGNDNAGAVYYDHASNYMRFFTNGSEQVRIDSAGNVGIGTNAPAYALDVSGAVDVRLGSGLGTDVMIAGTNHGITRQSNSIKLYNNAKNAYFGVRDSATGFVQISGANVGIDTTSPDEKFHVYDGAITDGPIMKIQDAAAHMLFEADHIYSSTTTWFGNGQTLNFNAGTASGATHYGSFMRYVSGSTEVWRATDTGLQLLDSKKLVLGTGDDFQIYHNATNNYISGSTGDMLFINTASDADMKFKIKDGSTETEVIRIVGATSRVGIGTTTPDFKLDVRDSSYNVALVSGAGNGNYPILHVKDSTDTSVAWFEGNRAGDQSSRISLWHNPASAHEGSHTAINFQMNDDANNKTTYARITSGIDDYTNTTEDGNLKFENIYNGTTKQVLKLGGHYNSSGWSVWAGEEGTSGFLGFANNTANNNYLKFGSYLTTGNYTIAGFAVGNNAAAGNQQIHMMAQDDITISAGYDGSQTDSGINFQTNNTAETTSTTRMRIDKTGNVGIGTTSPAKTLHIKKDAGHFRISSADYDLISMGPRGDSGSNLDKAAFNMMASDGSSKVYFDTAGDSYMNGGDVGIGTSGPTRKLDVRGTTLLSGGTLITGTLETTGKGTIDNELQINGGGDSTNTHFNLSDAGTNIISHASTGATTIRGNGASGDSMFKVESDGDVIHYYNSIFSGSVGVGGLITASGGVTLPATSDNFTMGGNAVNDILIDGDSYPGSSQDDYLITAKYLNTVSGAIVAAGGGGTIGGTVSANSIPYASSGDTLANFTSVYKEGNNIIMGTTPASITTDADDNTSLGGGALDKITDGDDNVAIGYYAARSGTTAKNNVAIGSEAARLNITGNYNVSVGYQANHSGTKDSNVVIGYQAAVDAGTHTGSVSIGYRAARYPQGNNNTAIGRHALLGASSPNTAHSNVGVGSEALTSISSGYQNTAIGYLAGSGTTTGAGNTHIGNQAGQSGQTGNNTVYIGNMAGYSNTSGDNVGIGTEALLSGTSATNLVAVGRAAGKGVTTGHGIIAIGHSAAQESAASTHNVAIGWQAMMGGSGDSNRNIGIGTSTLLDITTGDSNVGVGYQAAQNVTSGGYNIAIGNNALATATTSTGSVAIGHNAGNETTVNETIHIGKESGYSSIGSGTVFVGHQTGYYPHGNYNTFIGWKSGKGNASTTTAQQNVGVGANTLTSVSSAEQSVAIGYDAGKAITTANKTVAIGYQAGESITTGGDNVLIGHQAGKNTTGQYNVMMGKGAGSANTTANSNVFIGNNAAAFNQDGTQNTAVGFQAMYSNVSSTHNTIMGYNAAQNMTAGFNTIVGNEAGFDMTTGDYNVLMGVSAGANITGSQQNVIIGAYAGRMLQASKRLIAIGYEAAYMSPSGYQVAIGYGALHSPTTSTENIAIGTDALRGTSSSTAQYNVAIGNYSLDGVTNALNNVGIGRDTLTANTTGDNNIAIGYEAGATNTDGNDNTLVGYRAGKTINGGTGRNVMVGSQAGQSATTTDASTIIGYQAAGGSALTGDYNTAVGFQSGYALIGSVEGSVFLGHRAGYGATSGGYNTFLGYAAGQNVTTGAGNVAIGKNAGPSSTNTDSNKLYIHNAAGTPLIGGDFASPAVTINGALGVTGSLSVTGSTLAVQKEIKNDITGTHTLSDSYSHYMATAVNADPALATCTMTCPANPSVGDEYFIVAKCSYASVAPSNALVQITPNTGQYINQSVAPGSNIALNQLSSGTAPVGMTALETYKTAHLICIDADQWVLTISDVGPTS